ncbi:MAG: 1,4-alpha-glucan branching protein GlgB, partial [Clostridia bacterium]|nr:1,4-alpha-glucan branching protein GlgB [Clostridia bacterium]
MDAHQVHLFHQGSALYAQRYLGVHEDADGYVFRLFAPHAQRVYLVGDFNGWQANERYAMQRISEQGIWQIAVKGLAVFDNYKYLVYGADGEPRYKADPYAVHGETPGKGDMSSKVYTLKSFAWNDACWLRTNRQCHFSRPMNIYEVHLGSWQKREDGGFYDYRTLADLLVPYAVEMGYTHLELLPIMEHPSDDSWGYQVSGYFSVSARYGLPEDFKYFVNKCHENGLGVFLDWVPAHFAKDECGLSCFDGAPLYESADPAVSELSVWGTCAFDYAKPEVQSFLISNAIYWLEEYHVDGLRVDAVSAMLYGNRGASGLPLNDIRPNAAAISFLQRLNAVVRVQCPDKALIAEETTAYSGVTGTGAEGSLGFTFKWNVGWAHDTLRYMQTDPFFRKGVHHRMTFGMTYAFDESYILPLSHDEVTLERGSLIERMPGTYEERFANLRAYLGFMMSHPGKKLTFMGNEIGQFRAWDHSGSVEYFLLEYEKHRKLRVYQRALNHFYLRTAPLWQND